MGVPLTTPKPSESLGFGGKRRGEDYSSFFLSFYPGALLGCVRFSAEMEVFVLEINFCFRRWAEVE